MCWKHANAPNTRTKYQLAGSCDHDIAAIGLTPHSGEEVSMQSNQASWAALLERAVTEPGIISSAYSQFHNYSIGNQLLAWSQCLERGIPLGPMATYVRWQELGRHVKRGETALTLCQPVTIKREAGGEDAPDGPDSEIFVRFTYRNRWFVLAQTDGQDLPTAEIPSWDQARALAALDVTEIPFESADGNTLGYAFGRSIAINPVNPMPDKSRCHELGHILLGHTAEGLQADGEITPRTLRECEAEAVALLCCAALGLPGVECCRGYIQSWWGTGNPIPERSAQRIFKAADQILKAGTTEPADAAVLA